MDQHDDEWKAQARAASRLMGGSSIADMLKPNGEFRTYDDVVAEELALIHAERAKEEAKRTRLEHLARIDRARVEGMHEADATYQSNYTHPASIRRETPEERRTRLRARRTQLKVSGDRHFLKTLAAEEGVSKSRIKQLLADDNPPANALTAILNRKARRG